MKNWIEQRKGRASREESEGFLSRFFKNTLTKSLAKDKSLDKAIKDGDKALADLKKSAEIVKRKGIKVSPATKKAAAEFGIKL